MYLSSYLLWSCVALLRKEKCVDSVAQRRESKNNPQETSDDKEKVYNGLLNIIVIPIRNDFHIVD